MSKWTKDEIVWLREVYHTQSIQETADILGRSCGSVSRKAHSLGLRRYLNFGLKELTPEVARRAAKIFSKMGSVLEITPSKTNCLRNTIRQVRINAGRRSLPDIKWLLKNVGGRLEKVTASDRNRSWYIWGIYRQEDVKKFLEAVNADDRTYRN